MSKKSNTKTAAKAEATKAPAKPKTFKLAELSRELEKNPKAVRSRFRNIYRKDGVDLDTLPKTVNGPAGKGGWEFAEKDRAAVTAMVTKVDSTD